MARRNDSSPHPDQWTNAKLMAEARKYANLVSFSTGHYDGPEVTFRPGWASQTGSPEVPDFCREQTRLYRESWLEPILDELQRRFLGEKAR